MITVGKRIRAALDADGAAGDDVRLGRARFVDYVTTRDGSRARVRRSGLVHGHSPPFVWSRRRDRGRGGRARLVSPPDLVPGRFGRGTGGRRREPRRSDRSERGRPDRGAVLRGQLDRPRARRAAARAVAGSRTARACSSRRAPRTSRSRTAADPGKWRFEAGPVTVDVTGTRFRVDWNPEDGSFGLDLKEGSVIVGGDCLPTPRTRAAGRQRAHHLRHGRDDEAREGRSLAAPGAGGRGDKAAPVRAPLAMARHEARDVHVGRGRRLARAGGRGPLRGGRAAPPSARAGAASAGPPTRSSCWRWPTPRACPIRRRAPSRR